MREKTVASTNLASAKSQKKKTEGDGKIELPLQRNPGRVASG